MRALSSLIGIGCIVLGALLLSGKISRTASHAVLDVGILKAEAKTREAYPQWMGFAAIGVGVAFLFAGSGRRRV